MKNKPRSVRRGSKAAAASQPKTHRGKSRRCTALAVTYDGPAIALFPKERGEIEGCSEEIIDLSEAEYAVLKRAAAPSGDGVLMFMANAALEKAGSLGGAVTFVFKTPDGCERGRVDFPIDVFVRIERAASKLGITVEQFCLNAVRNECKRGGVLAALERRAA